MNVKMLSAHLLVTNFRRLKCLEDSQKKKEKRKEKALKNVKNCGKVMWKGTHCASKGSRFL